MTSTQVTRSLIGFVAVAAATVAGFYLFLGRDNTMDLDPATGTYGGPWTTAQVAGCLGTLLAVLVIAVLLRVPPLVAAAAMTVSFTVAWTVPAAADDETGLFLAGASFILFGMATGTVIVALLTAWAAKLVTGRPPTGRVARR
jgi:hypothetical protein